jgi:hypothetical protein
VHACPSSRSGVAESFAQVCQRASSLGVLPQLVDPGLHSLKSSLGGQRDLSDDRQFLAADRAGVQTEQEA